MVDSRLMGEVCDNRSVGGALGDEDAGEGAGEEGLVEAVEVGHGGGVGALHHGVAHE